MLYSIVNFTPLCRSKKRLKGGVENKLIDMFSVGIMHTHFYNSFWLGDSGLFGIAYTNLLLFVRFSVICESDFVFCIVFSPCSHEWIE